MEKLYVVKAENAGNLMINITFSDNTTQKVDVGDFIRRHPHPQYNKYLNPRKFSRFTKELGLDIPDRAITLRCDSLITITII